MLLVFFCFLLCVCIFSSSFFCACFVFCECLIYYLFFYSVFSLNLAYGPKLLVCNFVMYNATLYMLNYGQIHLGALYKLYSLLHLQVLQSSWYCSGALHRARHTNKQYSLVLMLLWNVPTARTPRHWQCGIWRFCPWHGVSQGSRTSEMTSPCHKKAESFNQKLTFYSMSTSALWSQSQPIARQSELRCLYAFSCLCIAVNVNVK